MENPQFKYKCICNWSKDDEYGFIPNANCPVHGKKVKELLKNAVPYKVKEMKEMIRRCSNEK